MASLHFDDLPLFSKILLDIFRSKTELEYCGKRVYRSRPSIHAPARCQPFGKRSVKAERHWDRPPLRGLLQVCTKGCLLVMVSFADNADRDYGCRPRVGRIGVASEPVISGSILRGIPMQCGGFSSGCVTHVSSPAVEFGFSADQRDQRVVLRSGPQNPETIGRDP